MITLRTTECVYVAMPTGSLQQITESSGCIDLMTGLGGPVITDCSDYNTTYDVGSARLFGIRAKNPPPSGINVIFTVR